MINIIIVDDNKIFLQIINDIVEEFLKNKKVNYKIYKFEEYEKEFYKLVNNNNLQNRILLLDIETKNNNGISVVNGLRKNNNKDHVIMISAYKKDCYRNISLNDLELFSYISKQEDLNKEIPSKLSEILNLLNL